MSAPRAFSLEAAGPVHLEGTVRLLQRRPHNPVERWEQGRHIRPFRLGSQLVLLAVENAGPSDLPELKAIVLTGKGDPEPLVPRLRAMHGLDAQPFPLPVISDAIPAAIGTMRSLRGVRPPRFDSLFEAILNTVPFQQVSIDAAMAITVRLVERFGERVRWDGSTWAAWPAEEAIAQASLTELRNTGLSTAKAHALSAAARAILDGELDAVSLSDLPTAIAAERLRQFPGIGPWTSHLILLRGFGRMDAFPPGDAGICRGLGPVLGAQAATPAKCEALAARVPGVSGYLYYLSLAGQQLQRGLITPSPEG
jgi:DNA-3-methyladenine glycosylase II